MALIPEILINIQIHGLNTYVTFYILYNICMTIEQISKRKLGQISLYCIY